MEFVPGSLVDLNGSGSAGGTLTVDGQAGTTRIVMTTTTGAGTFTIDRNSSTNMTIDNVAISNASYRSDDGGAAIELKGPEITNDMFVALHLEGSEQIDSRVVRNFDGGFALKFESDKAKQKHIREEVEKFKDIIGKRTY